MNKLGVSYDEIVAGAVAAAIFGPLVIGPCPSATDLAPGVATTLAIDHTDKLAA
jgi:hypothetical protein